MPDFTSNIKILDSSPELAMGVQNVANALVAKEQLKARKNEIDIQNFERLVSISAKGISAGDQTEITKDISGFRDDAMKRAMASKDAKLGLKDLNELKLKKEGIESKVAYSIKQQEEYGDVIEYTAKNLEDLDTEAMTEAFRDWEKLPIDDRPSPWKLVKALDYFNVMAHFKKTLPQNVKKGGYKIAGGSVRTEKDDPREAMKIQYANDPKVTKQINREYRKAVSTPEGRGKFVDAEDYMLKTYGPEFDVDNVIPTYKTDPNDPKAPVPLKRNSLGGWALPKAMKYQPAQGSYFTVDGAEHPIEEESFRNSQVVAVIPKKLKNDEAERLYVVLQVPKISVDEGIDTTGMDEERAFYLQAMQAMMPSSSKLDQENVTQVLIPYEDMKEVLGENWIFEGIDDYGSESDFIKAAKEIKGSNVRK